MKIITHSLVLAYPSFYQWPQLLEAHRISVQSLIINTRTGQVEFHDCLETIALHTYRYVLLQAPQENGPLCTGSSLWSVRIKIDIKHRNPSSNWDYPNRTSSPAFVIWSRNIGFKHLGFRTRRPSFIIWKSRIGFKHLRIRMSSPAFVISRRNIGFKHLGFRTSSPDFVISTLGVYILGSGQAALPSSLRAEILGLGVVGFEIETSDPSFVFPSRNIGFIGFRFQSSWCRV